MSQRAEFLALTSQHVAVLLKIAQTVVTYAEEVECPFCDTYGVDGGSHEEWCPLAEIPEDLRQALSGLHITGCA